MPLSGLQRRHPLCKICCAFDDDLLSEITADILLRRKTYKEIKDIYSAQMPEGQKPLNDVNINNHRKHSDPQFLVDAVLQKQGLTPPTETDVIVRLYKERRKESLDRKTIFEEVYRERLRNLELLQDMLDKTKKTYKELCGDPTTSVWLMQDAENRIFGITQRIDHIHDALQQVMIKDMNSDKGLGEGNTYINQNTVVVVQDGLKKFLDAFVPYLLHRKVFQENMEEGKEILKQISVLMDQYVTPTLDLQKALPVQHG
jgi:hypothetical protein